MSEPLVSVLIPAFNAARWIGDTLASVQAQSWRRLEVIVVDDGSSDDSASIARGFTGLRPRVISQARRGQSAAQNTAMQYAQGDLIQRLDADDLLSPDKIARQVARLEGRPDAVAVGEWARFWSRPDEAHFEARSNACDLDPVEWLVRDATGGASMLQAGLWLAPRALVEAAGPWNETLTLNNDYDYFVRLLLASREVLFCPGARLYYRSGNPSSLASERSPAAWDSAFRSLDLGTRSLLERDDSRRTQAACADLFQQLAYQAYLEDGKVSAEAEARAMALGGSSLTMTGGALFAMTRRLLGWKAAKSVKSAAYTLGYERIARFKERLLMGPSA